MTAADTEAEPLLGMGEGKKTHEHVYGSEDHLVKVTESDDDDDDDKMDVEGGMERKFQFSFRKLWAFTGPGWLMSIAYLDPGNIESDLQAGFVGRYNLLWVLLWATVFGVFVQVLALRLGVVTGRHLAEICRERFHGPVRYILWVMTEFAIIGSDIQEVLGSAVAINLLSNGYIPLWAGCIITASDTFTFLLIERFGVTKLEFLFGALITTMAITFGIEYGMEKPSSADVAKGVVIPQGSYYDNGSQFVTQAVGMIGAVIMPHNVYLHSALVGSRKINRKKSYRITEAIVYNTIESAVALFMSFIINVFVVSVFAGSRDYFQNDIVDSDGIGCYNSSRARYSLDGGESPGLLDGGCFLKSKFGTPYLYIWAIGVLAAGQSSTMTGTYAGQFVMQGFLDLKIAPWKRTLITRCIAIVPALLVGAIASNQIDAMGTWLNVLQNVQLPFAVLPVLIFTSDKSLMGKWANPLWVQAGLGIFTLGIIGVNVYLIQDAVGSEVDNSRHGVKEGVWAITGLCLVLYALYMVLLTYKGIYDRAPRKAA